jgi:hypothetical protein
MNWRNLASSPGFGGMMVRQAHHERMDGSP